VRLGEPANERDVKLVAADCADEADARALQPGQVGGNFGQCMPG
jgi:hypothetical protein